MSTIRQSLEALNGAISELESVASHLEQSLHGGQRDMFPETKKAMVKSLDAMIDHVETMIEEKAS